MARGELTSTDLTEAFLKRIESVDHKIASYITVTADVARNAARQADMEMKGGLRRGPMHGIPVALKDIYETAGIKTTGHSHLKKDYVPAIDAETVRRLKDGGAVILGKLGTHEFANGAMTPDQPFPAVRNPWNVEYQPGGSSSGSVRRSRPSSAWARWALIPAARSATPPATVPPPASNRPTGWSAAAGSIRSASASTRPVRSPGRQKTAH
jgi:hypothetical protein